MSPRLCRTRPTWRGARRVEERRSGTRKDRVEFYFYESMPSLDKAANGFCLRVPNWLPGRQAVQYADQVVLRGRGPLFSQRRVTIINPSTIEDVAVLSNDHGFGC